MIERDNNQGAAAKFKNLADPDDIGGTGTGIFTFPFVTIESVIPLGSRVLGILNDNNYPFSSAAQSRATGWLSRP